MFSDPMRRGWGSSGGPRDRGGSQVPLLGGGADMEGESGEAEGVGEGRERERQRERERKRKRKREGQ